MLDGGLRMRAMVLPDVFLDHDTPAAMYARAGLDAKGIVAKVFEALGKDYKTETRQARLRRAFGPLGSNRKRCFAVNPMKIYLAGPDVFLPDAVEIGRRKAAICAAPRRDRALSRSTTRSISPPPTPRCRSSGAIEAMMDAADAIIANLTPFRGPGADAGTVYELGYMAGRGKLCLGLLQRSRRLCRPRRRASMT